MPVDKIPVIVSRDVYEGILAMRESGATNMLDVAAVSRLAAEMDFYAATTWIRANKKSYAEGIFRGFLPADGVAAPPRITRGMEMRYVGRAHAGLAGYKVRVIQQIRRGWWEVAPWVVEKQRYSWFTSDAREGDLAPLEDEEIKP